MMGGHRGGPMGMMQQEALKPKNVSETLRRFGVYFKPFWLTLLLVAVLVIISTWTQVTGPQLLGQAVDCYLSPAQSAGGLSSLTGAPAQPATQPAASSCTYDPLASPAMSNDAKFAGLGGIVLKLVGLYLLGAVATGLTFYLMGWAGQHVLKLMRVSVFQHLHRLSLGYYAENEARNLM
ncbi:MAG TPA: ABC transporter transmembrane domain-containing protein, partial [Anaerolineae bacterium]